MQQALGHTAGKYYWLFFWSQILAKWLGFVHKKEEMKMILL